MPIPSFTQPVPDNGYRWWYLDAVSDDDKHAITVIVFIGSVFSPYYARARKRRPTPANAHCAVNVALYGKPWRWCMTERTHCSVEASNQQLFIGKSGIRLERGKLHVTIDEVAVPFPGRVQGELVIDLPDYELDAQQLDGLPESNTQNDQGETGNGASHYWQPIAPQTRIHVAFDQPRLSWQGSAYVDSNYGDVPLESSFKSWVWSRTHAADNATTILYDVVDRQGTLHQRGFHYSVDGTMTPYAAEQAHILPGTRYWQIARSARTTPGTRIDQIQTLEDTPFYSRTRFKEERDGLKQTTMHESLYLDKFDTSWVRCLLPFRMPRNTRPVLSEVRNVE